MTLVADHTIPDRAQGTKRERWQRRIVTHVLEALEESLAEEDLVDLAFVSCSVLSMSGRSFTFRIREGRSKSEGGRGSWTSPDPLPRSPQQADPPQNWDGLPLLEGQGPEEDGSTA